MEFQRRFSSLSVDVSVEKNCLHQLFALMYKVIFLSLRLSF